MTTINKEIAYNADLAHEIADIAEMLDEQFRAASLMIVQGMDLNHVQVLIQALKIFSAQLNKGMGRMSTPAR